MRTALRFEQSVTFQSVNEDLTNALPLQTSPVSQPSGRLPPPNRSRLLAGQLLLASASQLEGQVQFYVCSVQDVPRHAQITPGYRLQGPNFHQ